MSAPLPHPPFWTLRFGQSGFRLWMSRSNRANPPNSSRPNQGTSHAAFHDPAGRPDRVCRRTSGTSESASPAVPGPRQNHEYGTASKLPNTSVVLYHGGTLVRAPRKEAMPSAEFDFPPDPVGNHADFQYRPLNHPLLLHEEVPDHVENDLHLRKRLGLVLQHLAAHGRTSIVKGCGGVNQGWRRSPLGGNRGMQYYLWWTPDGSRPTGGVRRSEELNGSRIWVRAVRHHDDHAPLAIGSDASDYYSIGQNDIASHDDTFISPPDTENQARFVSDHNSVRVVHGHPGSGKTTALWKAIEARDNQRVLYVSWSRELTSLAAERLSTFAPAGVSVTTRDFLTLLGEICGYDVKRVAYEQSRAAFGQALARTRSRPADLGVWASREDALHAEVRAVLLGRAIPDGPGSAYIDSPTGESRLPRLTDAEYTRVRGGRNGVGDRAAGSLLTIAERIERHSAAELEKAFPELAAAAEAVRRLRRDHIPHGFDDFDRIVVDEAQDLTLVELAVVTELCRTIALRRRSAPWLLLAGDEGQTVRPSGFEWSLLSTLLAHTLTAPQRFTLDTTLRSPQRIARVIERASELYRNSGLERRLRPADQRHRPGGDPTDAQLFYVDAPSVGEAIRLLDRLNVLANVAIVTPGADPPAWLPDRLVDMVLTPAVVKGLEYQSVCVLEPGPTLQRLDAGVDLHSNSPELEAHSRRTAIDRLRVAISRATESLAFIEIAPDDATQLSSMSLLGNATTYSPDDLVEYLTSTDMLPEIMVPDLLNRVRELIDTAPGRAWQLAGQAVHLLGAQDAPGAVLDAATRREAHTTLLSTAARMLVDGLPPRVARSQVAAQAEHSAAGMGGEAFAEAVRHLDEWTQDRDGAPFGLLNAALTLGRDGDWLKDALPPVSQTVRESIERCAGDEGDAEHFTGDVEGWLALSGHRGDVATRARELRIRAATALLDAGRVVQAERVIGNVQPEDMRLNALFLEKSGRLEAAATLYERAGSSADANRIRTSAVRDRFRRFERRGDIASSNIYRLSADERRLVRAARRAVVCPSCGAEVGQPCMGSGGSPYSDSHVDRRRLAGSLSFEQIAASQPVADAAAALGTRDLRPSSGDEWLRERAARRAVACPRCGVDAGRQCVTPSGSPYSDSHLERRRAAGSSPSAAALSGASRPNPVPGSHRR